MIPFASVACLIRLSDGRVLEASLMDLSAIGFTLRLPRAWDEPLADGIDAITLRFHRFRDSGECTLAAGTLDWTQEEQTADWTAYRAETTDPSFRTLARQFMRDFAQYVALKEAQDDARLSQALTGYPAEGETCFPAHFAGQRRAWFAALAPDADWANACAAVPELAVSLASPRLWTEYLARPMTDFSRTYWASHDLDRHPIARRTFNAVYIGNAYCPLLFPDEDALLRLLDKAAGEGVRPILTLAPVSEGRLERVLALLDRIQARHGVHSPLELVVNDWGMVELLRDRPGFTLTLGVLLHRRRKDVRMATMQGFDGQGTLLSQTAAHAGFYRDALARGGAARLSWEACGQPFGPVPMPGSLHLPFYQMNTAGRCTMRAVCQSGDRGRQTPDDTCPGYCADHAFLYPEMLRMVGRYNTLFGYDARSLTDGAYLRQLTAGLDRLVIDLL